MYFRRKKKIGLVLGSGAAKGLAHIGVLKVLDELNIKVSFITGTSMGSLIGVLYASGYKAKDIENIALGIDRKELKKMFRITLDGAGFINSEKIYKLLAQIIPYKRIKDLPIPFACCAANIIDGREIIFKQGSVLNSIRSSISVPALFSPVKDNDNVLVDGGLVNPVPIDIAREMGADYIIAINVLAVPPLKHKSITLPQIEHIEHNCKECTNRIERFNSKIKYFIEKEIISIEGIARRLGSLFNLTDEINIIDIISQTVLIAERNIAKYKIEADKPDLLIEPDMRGIRHFDFSNIPGAIAIGEATARLYIKQLKKLI